MPLYGPPVISPRPSRGTRALLIGAAAFAGGIVCSGVMFGLGSGSVSDDARRAVTYTAERPARAPVSCEAQTWPYVDPACLSESGAKRIGESGPKRSVRQVGNDQPTPVAADERSSDVTAGVPMARNLRAPEPAVAPPKPAPAPRETVGRSNEPPALPPPPKGEVLAGGDPADQGRAPAPVASTQPEATPSPAAVGSTEPSHAAPSRPASTEHGTRDEAADRRGYEKRSTQGKTRNERAQARTDRRSARDGHQRREQRYVRPPRSDFARAREPDGPPEFEDEPYRRSYRFEELRRDERLRAADDAREARARRLDDDPPEVRPRARRWIEYYDPGRPPALRRYYDFDERGFSRY